MVNNFIHNLTILYYFPTYTWAIFRSQNSAVHMSQCSHTQHVQVTDLAVYARVEVILQWFQVSGSYITLHLKLALVLQVASWSQIFTDFKRTDVNGTNQ